MKRHDTYQKNCATVANEKDPTKKPPQNRGNRIANYDKANIGGGNGANKYNTNLNFSTKNYKGTHELRAECLGKPQDPPGGGACTLWKGGPAKQPGDRGDWGDLCRDDDLLYGAQTRFGGYGGHPTGGHHRHTFKTGQVIKGIKIMIGD